jgi:hypothetical protein
VGTPLVVTGAPPIEFETDGLLRTEVSESIRFLNGDSLILASGKDIAKVVGLHDLCAWNTSDAGGTINVTDLGPDDSLYASYAEATFKFTHAGIYKICYGVYPVSSAAIDRYRFVQVGSKLITVYGVAPTVMSTPSGFTGEVTTIRFSGGSGLDTAAGKDSAKMVFNTSSCDAAAEGGTLEMTDLTGNKQGQTAVEMNVSFTVASTYKACYKPSGREYVEGQGCDRDPRSLANSMVC